MAGPVDRGAVRPDRRAPEQKHPRPHGPAAFRSAKGGAGARARRAPERHRFAAATRATRHPVAITSSPACRSTCRRASCSRSRPCSQSACRISCTASNRTSDTWRSPCFGASLGRATFARAPRVPATIIGRWKPVSKSDGCRHPAARTTQPANVARCHGSGLTPDLRSRSRFPGTLPPRTNRADGIAPWALRSSPSSLGASQVRCYALPACDFRLVAVGAVEAGPQVRQSVPGTARIAPVLEQSDGGASSPWQQDAPR